MRPKAKRDEDKKERATERLLEREARAEDAKRHKMLMEVMLLAKEKK